MNANGRQLSAVVLAGGRGTRMGSKVSKLLLELNGKPIIQYIVRTLQQLTISEIIVVLGYQANAVRTVVSEVADQSVHFGTTPAPWYGGTGEAIRVGCCNLSDRTSDVLVVNGDDSAFYSHNTLRSLIEFHVKREAILTMLLVKVEPNLALNRIYQDQLGKFDVISYEMMNERSLYLEYVSTGAYVFDHAWLVNNVNRLLKSLNKQVSIFELVHIAQDQSQVVSAMILENRDEWMSINTPGELNAANELMQRLARFNSDI